MTKKTLQTAIQNRALAAQTRRNKETEAKMNENIEILKDRTIKAENKFDDLKVAFEQRVKMQDQELYTRCQLYAFLTEMSGAKMMLERRLD